MVIQKAWLFTMLRKSIGPIAATLVLALIAAGQARAGSGCCSWHEQSSETSGTKVAEILANPSAYNGRYVSVFGVVRAVQPNTSRTGNDYEIFSLCDSSCLKVLAWGHPGSVQEGRQLSAGGIFWAVKRLGRYRFLNEIDAYEIDADAGSP